MASSGFNAKWTDLFSTDLFSEDLSGWLGNFGMQMPQCGAEIPGSNGAHPLTALAAVTAIPAIDELPIPALLQFAQQQLQISHLPASVKIALYLKICCLAIQKSFLAEQPIPAERLYHNLMQWLSECEPEWWQQCIITARGITSDNVRIQDLLQPLTDFVQQEI